jgi:hypothetical protein
MYPALVLSLLLVLVYNKLSVHGSLHHTVPVRFIHRIMVCYSTRATQRQSLKRSNHLIINS